MPTKQAMSRVSVHNDNMGYQENIQWVCCVVMCLRAIAAVEQPFGPYVNDNVEQMQVGPSCVLEARTAGGHGTS